MTETARRLSILAAVLVAFAALSGPVLLFAAGGRSSAAFGDAEALGGNHLGAATLDIEVGERSARLQAALMAPGHTTLGWLDLANRGDVALRYSVVAENSGGALLDWMRWDVWSVDGQCADGPAPGARIVTNAAMASGSGVLLVGDPAPGLHPGDQSLDPGDEQRLCIRASLPSETPNTIQGQTLTLDLLVAAEHRLEGEE